MLVSFSISRSRSRSRTRSRMSAVTSRKRLRPGVSRNGSRLSCTSKLIPWLSQRRVSTSTTGRPALRFPQEVLQLLLPVRWDRRQPMTEDLAFCKPVKTFRRRVPFRDAQFEVVERHRAGRGFQEMPIVLSRSAQLLLAATTLAEHVPGRPCREQQRGGHAAADVQVVQRHVIDVAEKTGLDELPRGKDEGREADAPEEQRDPEPAGLRRAPMRTVPARPHRAAARPHPFAAPHGTFPVMLLAVRQTRTRTAGTGEPPVPKAV